MRTIKDELIILVPFFDITGTNKAVRMWTTWLWEDGALTVQYGSWIMAPPEKIRDFGKGKE
jgi:hypothetical protein